MKECIVDGCHADCEKGRRYCRAHYLERKRRQAREKYAAGHRRVGKYDVTCEYCGAAIKAHRKEQKFCSECYKKVHRIGAIGVNNYENAGGGGYCWKHRRIAEEVLKRRLATNEVVHHMNGDPTDNSLENLVVISRGKHASLHNYLRMQGALLLKSNKENFENCWKSLIVPMTTTWLETANVKVIKLWEIGQSAAEPLNNGEGSETMHEAPKLSDEHGDDIVQTTTV